jgi:TetR/AcrR family transcriptional repressor of nem operon
MGIFMPRPTKHHPERGDAKTRLLEAARDTIRAKGFAATSVDDLCQAAAVTKGSFFHHFKSKEELGVAFATPARRASLAMPRLSRRISALP